MRAARRSLPTAVGPPLRTLRLPARRPRGPGGLRVAPLCLSSPALRRWLIGAAGSLLGKAGGEFAGGGWFPPSLTGLIG